MFSMSKANGADDGTKEKDMSFHKIVPVKKNHKPAPAPKRPAPKKPEQKRRPVGDER
jgi:hypothetical protein